MKEIMWLEIKWDDGIKKNQNRNHNEILRNKSFSYIDKNQERQVNSEIIKVELQRQTVKAISRRPRWCKLVGFMNQVIYAQNARIKKNVKE